MDVKRVISAQCRNSDTPMIPITATSSQGIDIYVWQVGVNKQYLKMEDQF